MEARPGPRRGELKSKIRPCCVIAHQHTNLVSPFHDQALQSKLAAAHCRGMPKIEPGGAVLVGSEHPQLQPATVTRQGASELRVAAGR